MDKMVQLTKEQKERRAKLALKKAEIGYPAKKSKYNLNPTPATKEQKKQIRDFKKANGFPKRTAPTVTPKLKAAREKFKARSQDIGQMWNSLSETDKKAYGKYTNFVKAQK